MSVLDRLFRRGTGTAGGDHAPAVQMECAHVAMTPRWDRVEDMGRDDLTTSFVCDSCHRTLTPAEATTARQAVAGRLQHRE